MAQWVARLTLPLRDVDFNPDTVGFNSVMGILSIFLFYFHICNYIILYIRCCDL